MEWFGKAAIRFTHADTPRLIHRSDGTVSDILNVCREATPPCHLNPLLFNGHAQTLWTATKPKGPELYYKRKIFESTSSNAPGTFAVDVVVHPFEEEDPTLFRRIVYFTDGELARIGSDDSKPMLVVLHGLCGGSHEVYLRQAIAPLADTNQWEICVINARGCARSKITQGGLSNARETSDVRQVGPNTFHCSQKTNEA